MKNKIFGILLSILGILVAITPRYILPVCELTGKQKMACSYTGAAEMFIGVVLISVSIGIFFSNSKEALRWLMFVAFFDGLSVILLPSALGYCANPNMPCNYGTIPMLRLWGAAIVIISILGFSMSIRARA